MTSWRSRAALVGGMLVVAVPAMAQESHVLVVAGGDTTRLAVTDVIELRVGEAMQLVPRLFAEDGSPRDTVWWHNVTDEFIDLTRDGRVTGLGAGEVDVMLHWGPGDLHWIAIRVLPPRRGSEPRREEP